ncbi:MAG TPA: hypothetical protein VF698_03920 [Thermoanaerobaculia bacterium]
MAVVEQAAVRSNRIATVARTARILPNPFAGPDVNSAGMRKAAAIVIGLVVIVVQLCCTPSLEAALPDEPLFCPITGAKCQTSEAEKCDGEKPILASPVAPDATTPPLVAIEDAPVAPLPHVETPVVSAYWSTPTRTIQLRI